jgi:hypothetical protein
MQENYYFEGSENFYADVEFDDFEYECLPDAAWVSQR